MNSWPIPRNYEELSEIIDFITLSPETVGVDPSGRFVFGQTSQSPDMTNLFLTALKQFRDLKDRDPSDLVKIDAQKCLDGLSFIASCDKTQRALKVLQNDFSPGLSDIPKTVSSSLTSRQCQEILSCLYYEKELMAADFCYWTVHKRIVKCDTLMCEVGGGGMIEHAVDVYQHLTPNLSNQNPHVIAAVLRNTSPDRTICAEETNTCIEELRELKKEGLLDENGDNFLRFLEISLELKVYENLRELFGAANFLLHFENMKKSCKEIQLSEEVPMSCHQAELYQQLYIDQACEPRVVVLTPEVLDQVVSNLQDYISQLHEIERRYDDVYERLTKLIKNRKLIKYKKLTFNPQDPIPGPDKFRGRWSFKRPEVKSLKKTKAKGKRSDKASFFL